MHGYNVRIAQREDLGAVLGVQYDAFSRVARELGLESRRLPPLTETIQDLNALFDDGVHFFVATVDGRVAGSVRARRSGAGVEFGRLVVAADHLRRGVATGLMIAAEATFDDVDYFELFTGEKAHAALALYRGLGYEVDRAEDANGVPLVWLRKFTDTFGG